MAFLVFQLFSDQQGSMQQKTAGLAKLLRETPPKKAVDAFATHVGALTEWKRSVSQNDQKEGGEVSKNSQQKEYGSHLLFSYDVPDFCAREPRKISKKSEVVVMNAPQASAKLPELAIRSKANWLEDECSK